MAALFAVVLYGGPAASQPVASGEEAAEAAEPAAPAAPAAATTTPTHDEPGPGPVAGYNKGFFVHATDGPFELKIQGRVQARFTYEALEDEKDEQSFSIPRARLTLSGKAFTKALSFKFQSDFGKGFVTLKDFFVDYEFFKDGPRVRAGQFKRPFSRQQINSSGRLEFVDRAITDKAFGAGRDLGVMIHNHFEKSPQLEYAVGVFNGTGDKSHFSGVADPTTGAVGGGAFGNVPKQVHPMIAARAGYNHGGIKGYQEADLEGGPFRFAAAASGLVDLDNDDDGESFVRGELDFMVKVSGLTATGGIFLSSDKAAMATTQNVGLHAQLGYLLGQKFQPSFRYALVSPEGADNNVQEILGGFSVYFFEHGLKWQTDVGALIEEAVGGGTTTMQARTQLQMSF